MVTIALKSEALFAIIGVGAVLVIVCVAAALCYTCQRRGRRSKGGGKQGEITEGELCPQLMFISMTCWGAYLRHHSD